MTQLQVLQITTAEELAEVTAAGIVVCAYQTPGGESIDGIPFECLAEYPDLPVVDVVLSDPTL